MQNQNLRVRSATSSFLNCVTLNTICQFILEPRNLQVSTKLITGTKFSSFQKNQMKMKIDSKSNDKDKKR